MMQRESAEKLTLAFLDVGQGDAVLITKAERYDVLIDGGPDPTILRRLGEALPWYDNDIDWLLLTHNHTDHYMGLIAVLDKYKVERLLVSELAEPLPPELLQALERNKVPYSKLSAGTELNLEPNVKLRVLWPKADQVIAEMNDRSLVVELIAGEQRALLAGDAGVVVEGELLKNQAIDQVEIFKLSHHGSDTANSQEFLEALKPEWVVAQAGIDNSFDHPNRRVLKRVERVGAQIARNDLEGTIVFETDGLAWVRK
jgi:competence protein ComEC